MIKLKEIIQELPEPDYKSKMIINNQSTNDIIKEISQSNKLYSHQGEYIEPYFKGSNNKIVNDIYDFMKYELTYEIEPDEQQTSRSPIRILFDNYDGIGIDCKGYALLSAAILKAKGIPYKFRYVSYNALKPLHHVYTMAYINNEWVHIDPLQKSPNNYEKKYIFVKDVKPKEKNMLVRMSGIGQTTKDKFSNALLKPAGVVARTAFLKAVRSNFANVGGKLKKAHNQEPTKILNWWYSLGGNKAALLKALDKVPGTALKYTGVKPPAVYLNNPLRANPERAAWCREKYPATISINRGACTRGIIKGIGADPAVAAVLTAAAPVLLSLTALLKTIQGFGQEDVNRYATFIDDYETPAPSIQEGIPLPLILLGGGILAYFLLFPDKK